jgi:hypothetical protein
MKAMKLTLVACLVLAALACKDPNSFQPFDPTKPDPPAAPQLTAPADSWLSDSYAYPQEVWFSWQPIPGAGFYQFEVYKEWTIDPRYVVFANQRLTLTALTTSIAHYGRYCWRVRAASWDWNYYTNWSAPFRFGLPNPAR